MGRGYLVAYGDVLWTEDEAVAFAERCEAIGEEERRKAAKLAKAEPEAPALLYTPNLETK